jgi:hypothetical protein
MPLASHCGRHWSYHATETDFPHPGFFCFVRNLEFIKAAKPALMRRGFIKPCLPR